MKFGFYFIMQLQKYFENLYSKIQPIDSKIVG